MEAIVYLSVLANGLKSWIQAIFRSACLSAILKYTCNHLIYIIMYGILMKHKNAILYDNLYQGVYTDR